MEETSNSNTWELFLKNTIYTLKANNIDGRKVGLSNFTGKVSLVVNVASKCGFTSQYIALEALYRKFKNHGFLVLGFPSNDFLKQEPGTNEEIKIFCIENYNVTFPMFEKNSVKGSNKQPLYRVLTETSAKKLNGAVRWNFEKFLVNKNGVVVNRWRSMTVPN